jgi:hypothetical protein
MTQFWRPPYLTDFQIARGGGGGQPQTTVQTQTLPPFIQQAGEAALGTAQQVAARPYQADPYAQVVPMSADASQAYKTIENMQGQAAPAFQQAESAITGGGLLGQVTPITASGINANTQALMNPYISSVIAPTTTQMRQALAQQMEANNANAANVGAFGGSRLGVQQGTAQGQEAVGEGQLVGGLLSQGYQNAQTAAQQIAQQNLGAGEWATGELPQLAAAGAGETAKEAGLLEQAGRAQQGQTQAEMDQAAQNWETQWNYPIQALSVLESVLGTTPHGYTTTTQGPPPTTNTAGQVIGGVGAAASLIGALAAL